jgi:threonine synthase
VTQAVSAFRRDGALPADDQAWQAAAKSFAGHRVDDAGTLAEIGNTYKETGMLIDPHTAVAVAAARARLKNDGDAPMVALATAHPAKFADAVERGTGIRPPLPPALAAMMDKPERVAVLPNDIATVSRFIRERARLQARAA